MKKITAFLLIVVFLISGCSFNVEVVTPVPAPVDSGSETQAVEIPISTAPTVIVTPDIGFTPTTSDPIFFGAYTALDQAATPGQSSFPAGTKQVFAIMIYQNMRAGLTIKREWYLDGNIWLTREEPWDFSKYGASGTMQDVSIYDTEVGLDSGAYQLRVYINNVQQPIGNDTATLNYLNFVIQPYESYTGIVSPDLQWTAEIYGGRRIVIRDVHGTPKDLYTGREIPYLTWFANSRELLFVDRDRSQQQSDTSIGVRDNLWIANIQTGDSHLLYEGYTAFSSHNGLMLSTYEKYIVSLEGSGYADACMVDSRLIFFELANDRQSVTVIKQEQFTGLPASSDGTVYPMDDGAWEADNLFHVTLDGTCAVDRASLGQYMFNISARTTTKSSAASAPPTMGDLGWGTIHGKITDAATGAPIAGALVTCQHSSYTSPATCSGNAITNADGNFIFSDVFFHDTDSIKLTVQAVSYQSQEITQSFFTMADMEKDFALSKAQ
jgi:hypothetical protein